MKAIKMRKVKVLRYYMFFCGMGYTSVQVGVAKNKSPNYYNHIEYRKYRKEKQCKRKKEKEGESKGTSFDPGCLLFLFLHFFVFIFSIYLHFLAIQYGCNNQDFYFLQPPLVHLYTPSPKKHVIAQDIYFPHFYRFHKCQ